MSLYEKSSATISMDEMSLVIVSEPLIKSFDKSQSREKSYSHL